MIFAELPTPFIFAHRGSSMYAPENTMAAFTLALRQGADGIELDAKLSADGQVVVIHDQTVDRTTKRSGSVSSFTCEQLQKMDAGSHFDMGFQRESIPRLDSVLEHFGTRCFINIELTNYNSIYDKLPLKVIQILQQLKLESQVLLSSFNPIALLKVHHHLPDTPIGLLAPPGKKGFWARSWLGRFMAYQSLNLAIEDVSSKLVQKEHKKGKKVFAYTANRKEDINRLINLNVDGIFSDDPVLARKMLNVAC
ncbi:glycerophosphodiester phosphodiesterase [Chloroflexota bacterium]